MSSHCVGQKNKFQKRYIKIYSNQYTNEYSIDKFRKQQFPRLNLTNDMDLWRDDKVCALSNFSIYYTLKNIKELCKKTNSQYLKQHGMERFNCWCSLSNIQDYFEYISQEHETLANKLPVQIYVSKIKKKHIHDQNQELSSIFDAKDYETTWKCWKMNNQKQIWEYVTTRNYWSSVSSW